MKLEHLLLDDKMKLKVGGFHFATKLDFEGERKRTVCGTPKYIAPEILNDNRGYSYEVDIWSLGIIMYTLLIGKTPFESNNENTTYKRIKMMDYTFPEETNISEAAKNLISQILVCDPSKRPKLDQILKHDFFLQEPSIQKSLQVSKISDLKQNMPDTKLIKKPFNDNSLGNNNEKDLKEKINQLNELLLEEKNKNEVLSKKINEYINTINKLNNEISEEKNKYNMISSENNILNKENQRLNSIINTQNNNQVINSNSNNSNEMIKLYKKIEDLQEKLKRYPFILEENEKLISIIFSSINQKMHYSIICKNTDKINKLEEELYREYPDFSETDNIFMCKGKILNKFKTFESNSIKNGDIILVNQKEE